MIRIERHWCNLFLFFLYAAIVSGCHSGGSETKEPAYGYAVIEGLLGEANVSFFDLASGEAIATSRTGACSCKTRPECGRFAIPDAVSLNVLSKPIRIEVVGGFDAATGKPFTGRLEADIESPVSDSSITVSPMSTLLHFVQRLETNTTGVIERVFLAPATAESFYRFSFPDIQKLPFKNRMFYKRLLESGWLEALDENGSTVTAWLLEDSDGDGLENLEEILHLCDTRDTDSDRDGLEDGFEVAESLDPFDPDSDGDSISDGNETYVFHTDARKADTDEDFLPDAVEITDGTDPLDPDENRDGVPDGLEGDPFFDEQWYIRSDGDAVANTAGATTVPGNDLGILDLNHITLGAGIVQIVDSGVDAEHEDLNVDLDHSWNVVTHTHDPTPVHYHSSDPVTTFYNGHGTAVAGIVAARANNGKGIRGIAPRIKIAGSNWLETENIDDLDLLWFSASNADEILVSNNSWGGSFVEDTAFEEILRAGTSQLRNGLGRIYVFAAGNDREEHGNANLSYITNNPYVVTVGAINHRNEVASYSSKGSNILVTAYGGEHYYSAPTIMTTFLTGESMTEEELGGRKGPVTVGDDIRRAYTFAMNGTSAAAPMVSGAIALVLDVCPQLSYRDVKWIIAHTARRIDPENESWIRNGAGLYHSVDYGFGLIDTIAMVDRCRNKGYAPLPDEQIYSVQSGDLHINIPDRGDPVFVNLHVPKDMIVEWMGLTAEIDHPYAGDIQIDIISPSGTDMPLIQPNFLNFNAYKRGFRFGSVAFMGERSAGRWRIRVQDMLEEDSGTLRSLKLEIRGHLQ
ncbi:S8 family serine peptidase [Hydrogenimonas cancrithermarum]|uniref:P/Homo B domain-containing protein n=1 Tax=Hydrogenimonas cancrithermarum TaxID=2993563 RepID=A0ABM8FK15_9BACT|nr:S8 family serine peptidase [Hydrogenimonas cancrithermarum]BDY12650.1 hypothetical protein HCR_09620 [Hydrogenimonas cancrithermarum]